MKRHDRVPEIYFYEWSVSRWRSSETRAQLSPLGRGIYREILDLCYVQGSIPKDLKILAAQCDCSMADLETIWPVIGRHFCKHKRDAERLTNKTADVIRENCLRYFQRQKRNAQSGGNAKALGIKNIPSSGSATFKSGSAQYNTIQDNTIQKNTTTERRGAALTITPGEILQIADLGEFAERLYARHPKKRNKPLVEQFIAGLPRSWELKAKRVGAETLDEFLAVIEASHVAECSNADWQKEAGRYAPKLDEWLSDEGYTAHADRIRKQSVKIPEPPSAREVYLRQKAEAEARGEEF